VAGTGGAAPDIAPPALYRALGLLGEADGDLDSACLGLAGLYDPASKRILLVTGGAHRDRGDTLLHELVHAAQDHAQDLAGYRHRHYGSLDAALAASALLEGQAGAVAYLAALQSLDPQRAERLLADALGPSDASEGPAQMGLEALVRFPYEAGLLFVLRRHQAGEQDFRAMLQRVPATTEQVLHRDKFLANEAPAPVPLSTAAGPLAARLGAREVHRTRLGEWVLRTLLAHLDPQAAAAAAAGWAGDLAVLLRDPGGADLLVLDTLWDHPQDAEEFQTLLRRPGPPAGAEGPWAGREVQARRDGPRRVLAVLGPVGSSARIREVLSAIGGGPPSATAAPVGPGAAVAAKVASPR
jgi:hypothetical protein